MIRRILETGPIAIAQVLAMVGRFGMLVLAARTVSVAEFGTYSVVSSVLAWSGVLAMGGWPTYLVAVVPKAGLAASTLRRIEGRVLLTSLGLAVPQGVLLFVALGEAFAIEVALAAGLLLVMMAAATVANEAHRATGRVLSSRLLFAIVPPMVTVALLVLFREASWHVPASLLVCCVAAGWAALWFSARLSINYDEGARDRLRGVQEYNRRDFLLIKIAQSVLASADVFVVAFIAGVEASALYGVARRVAVVAGLGLNAVSMLYGPRLSRISGDPAELRRLTRESTLISAALSVPFALVIGLFSSQVLSVFGVAYKGASSVLLVLLIGVGVSGVFGPIGTVVHVNGQERFSRRVMLWTTATYLVLLPLSVVLYGPIGAAASWTAVTVGWNLVLWRGVDYTRGAR